MISYDHYHSPPLNEVVIVSFSMPRWSSLVLGVLVGGGGGVLV